MKTVTIKAAIAAAILALSSCSSSDSKVLYIVTTGDVHGAWFDRPYVEGGQSKTSLVSVSHFVDSLRHAVGRNNLLLLDAGDILQGDNASYYYNFVDTLNAHLYPRIASYMNYDAVAVGNHDIETGHEVYDRVSRQLKGRGVHVLGGNCITPEGGRYFQEYCCFRRAGKKVLVLGYTNPAIKTWLSEELWSGMDFESLIPLVQNDVDYAVAKEEPDVVIVLAHSGVGDEAASVSENQCMALFNGLEGVDLIVSAHDHTPRVLAKPGRALVNAGSKAANVGLFRLSDSPEGRTVEASVVHMDKDAVDEKMIKKFDREFADVRDFTNRPVGQLDVTLKSRDAFCGMSDFMNLIHSVQLEASGAQVSFAAPLNIDGVVNAGTMVYNDMFTLYTYENQLYVVKMKGSEIKDYLECSYDSWIEKSAGHIFRLKRQTNYVEGNERWAFANMFYNFDSAAGLNYTVDILKDRGQRISILSLADGAGFDPGAWYDVAVNSYRVNGGGSLFSLGAGISDLQAEGRIVAKLPEVRELVYRYICEHKTITPELLWNPSLVGSWSFVPESVAQPLLEADMNLVYN